jgi:hypothetical protein
VGEQVVADQIKVVQRNLDGLLLFDLPRGVPHPNVAKNAPLERVLARHNLMLAKWNG